MLGADLDLFADAMSLQLALVKDAYPSQYRTHSLAAIMALWSRSYSYLSDGVLLATRGSYPSTLPLVRAAAESIAAQEGLRAEEMDMHHEWLANTLLPNEPFKAFEFHLGHYFAGGVLHGDPLLRSIYRPAAELGRPAFGASLLQVAPESNNIRVAIAFADQIVSPRLGRDHPGLAAGAGGPSAARDRRRRGHLPGVAGPSLPAYEALQKQIDASLARDDRCRVEEVEDRGDRRYLVHNFRRASSGSPKKILL